MLITMQSSSSHSSISSSLSSNSSTYGARTILEAKDLPSAAPRCRSSIVALLDSVESVLSSPKTPPRPPPRRSQPPAVKCRHLLRTCLSSSSSPISLPTQSKLSDSTLRKQYFAKLCHNRPLLLVLSDYQCKCGCHFSMREGSFVIMYENLHQSTKRTGLVTVISTDLVCSKVPVQFVCDVRRLREQVRRRPINSDEQSFDL